MNNNRGQVLTFFVLMLPLFVVLLILTIDISNLIINRLEIDNVNRIIIDYALDNKDEINLETLVKDLANINDSKLEVNLNIEEDKINIILNKEIKGIVSKKNIYDLSSHFEGYIENDKKIIKKIKG